MPVKHRGLLTIGIMGANLTQVLDTTIANVALPKMQASLGATIDSVTWVLTSYIVAAAVVIPATGWLADRFGSRNLFLFAVSAFVGASMLCGVATSLEEMVAFRAMQGVAGAFIGPLSQTAMLDIYEPEKQAKAISIWGMGVMVGPILGPIVGGVLTENYNWRWVFYLNVPLGAVTLAILWLDLPSRSKKIRSFDGTGFGLIAVAVASLQMMLDRGQSQEWFSSTEIIIEAIVAAICTWMAIVHLATAHKPLFPSSLFKNKNIVMGMVFMTLIGMTSMAPLALLPPMIQQLYGYSVVYAGMLMVPRGCGLMLSMWLAGRFLPKIGARYLMITGLLIYGLALRSMAGWSLDMDSTPIITIGFAQGFGMGLVFIPLNSLSFSTLDPAQRTEGSSLLQLMRNIGQSVGISIVTVLLARNIQISHADISQHINAASIPGLNLLSSLGSISDSVFAMADAMVNKQALMIGYIDDFYLMGWVSLAVIPLVFLLKQPKGKIEIVHSE